MRVFSRKKKCVPEGVNRNKSWREYIVSASLQVLWTEQHATHSENRERIYK